MDSLADDVRRLAECLSGIEELEILLTLARDPERQFSSAQVGTLLRIVHPNASLERLAELNLLDVRLVSNVLYRFAPSDPGVVVVVRALADEYARRRPLVVACLGKGI